MNKLAKRIFDSDPYLAELDAVVESCEKIKEGFAVILSQTIFFPRGGGQNCDGGTIADLEVLDCYEENGEILHILPQPLEPGQQVHLAINFENRLDHMQHHLAQHILSALMVQMYQNDTKSAHMEEGYGHIEIERPLTPMELVELELAANDLIAKDLPVKTAYYTPEEAQQINVRGKITPHDMIRLVEIVGFDINACGGSHCRSTSGIGKIIICGTKEVRGLFRLYFKSGKAAFEEEKLRTAHLIAAQQALNVEMTEALPETARNTVELLRAAEARALAAAAHLEEADLERYHLACEDVGGIPFLARVITDHYNAKHFKNIGDKLVKVHKATVLFALVGEGETALILMRPKGGKTPDLGAVLKNLLAKYEGKGGGSPVMAQGQLNTSADDAIADIEAAFAAVRQEMLQA